MSEHHTLPFTIKVSDYSKLEGLLHPEQASLRLEFYHKETVLNWFGSDLKQTLLPLNRISGIHHIPGWFSDLFVIRMKSLSDAEAIPGSRMAEVRLKIKKRDRPIAQRFLVDLNFAMSQQRLEDLEHNRH